MNTVKIPPKSLINAFGVKNNPLANTFTSNSKVMAKTKMYSAI